MCMHFANICTTQGRVRTKTVKKAARVLVEKYYTRLTHDFQTNKKIAEDVAIIPSKRLRNKIAGFATVRSLPAPHLPLSLTNPFLLHVSVVLYWAVVLLGRGGMSL